MRVREKRVGRRLREEVWGLELENCNVGMSTCFKR